MRHVDLVIARLTGLSKIERCNLCKKTGSEADLKYVSKGDLFNTPFNIDEAFRLAERDSKIMELHNINAVSIAEPSYPDLLREIYDPPAIIYYRGELENTRRCVAMVGTRAPSSQALGLCYNMSCDLGMMGVQVVSGLALGIDAMCHRGNVEGGGKTIAVLGSAVDIIYPKTNRQLAVRILEHGGAILSEYPPGTPPNKWQFPERNRIISGLCQSVIIVEAPQKSGALITASFALEQDRDLWVLSHGLKPFGEGCMALAESGAHLIGSAEDVFSEWGIEIPEIKTYSSISSNSLAGTLAKELGL
jgi:DNA processing protein